jgi:putative intracellular protease/amidase
MIAHVMLAEKQFDPTPQLLDFLDAQHVLGAWIFLICAALYLAAAGGVPEFARRLVASARRT